MGKSYRSNAKYDRLKKFNDKPKKQKGVQRESSTRFSTWWNGENWVYPSGE